MCSSQYPLSTPRAWTSMQDFLLPSCMTSLCSYASCVVGHCFFFRHRQYKSVVPYLPSFFSEIFLRALCYFCKYREYISFSNIKRFYSLTDSGSESSLPALHKELCIASLSMIRNIRWALLT